MGQVVSSWKARTPEASGCCSGSGVVTLLLASTLRGVQHRWDLQWAPGVPLGPHSYLLDFKGGPQSEDQCGPIRRWGHCCCLLSSLQGGGDGWPPRAPPCLAARHPRSWVLPCDWAEHMSALGMAGLTGR